MFGVLVESAPLRRQSVAAGTSSTLAHLALLGAVVTAGVRAPTAPPAGAAERVAVRLAFAPPRPAVSAPGRSPARRPDARRATPRRAVRRPTYVPAEGAIAAALAAPVAVPELDVGRPPGVEATLDALAAGDGGFDGAGLEPAGFGALPTPAFDDVYRELDTERPPLPLEGSDPPRYPPPLLRRGIGGTVVARFVVDTAGAPEVGSLEILSSSDELFARSVREAVRHLRFVPAQLAGRSVKALVVQPFQFVVR